MVVCELVRRVSQPLRTVQDLERRPEHICLSDTYVMSYIESVSFVSTFYEKRTRTPVMMNARFSVALKYLTVVSFVMHVSNRAVYDHLIMNPTQGVGERVLEQARQVRILQTRLHVLNYFLQGSGLGSAAFAHVTEHHVDVPRQRCY